MSMNVKSVVIYLAIVLAGYVVVSIADSFAASEISTRLKISKAKVIFTQVDSLISSDDLFITLLMFLMIFLYFSLDIKLFISVKIIMILRWERVNDCIYD